MFALFEFYPFRLAIGLLVLFPLSGDGLKVFLSSISVLLRVFLFVDSYLAGRLFPPAILLTAPNVLDFVSPGDCSSRFSWCYKRMRFTEPTVRQHTPKKQ